jgi:hypothetical protein
VARRDYLLSRAGGNRRTVKVAGRTVVFHGPRFASDILQQGKPFIYKAFGNDAALTQF